MIDGRDPYTSDGPAGVCDRIDIRDLGEDDVSSLIACIRRCYGESYTEPGLYDPDHVRRELRAGRLLSVGALAGSRVVGHIGTLIRKPGDTVGDTIGGIVDPDYRGQGLLLQMGRQLFAGYQQRGIIATRHLATGVHVRTQRPLTASGAVATGVLLGHVPAATEYRGIQHGFGDARRGVVVYFQAYGRLDPLDVHVSDHYAELIENLYEQLDLERRVVRRSHNERTSENQGARPWGGSAHHDPRTGISILRFGPLGVDAMPATELVEATLPQCQEITYADVPIADPRSHAVIDRLKQDGFCFGALLPGTATSETIRMQRLPAASIAPQAIQTASEPGRALLAWILRDFESNPTTLGDIEQPIRTP